MTDVLNHIADLARRPMPVELMIGLRVLVTLACAIVLHAQWRAWRRRRITGCRAMIMLSNILMIVGFAASAILTARGGSNTYLYQLLILAAVLLRSLADAINAGTLRRHKRSRK